jgi:hypothetical protein
MATNRPPAASRAEAVPVAGPKAAMGFPLESNNCNGPDPSEPISIVEAINALVIMQETIPIFK